MDFALNDEHKLVQNMVRDFAEKEVAPLVKEYDRRREYPLELLPRMAELGLLGVCIPVKYGGVTKYLPGIADSVIRWSSIQKRLPSVPGAAQES